MKEPKFKYEGGDNFAAYDVRGRAMHLPSNGRVQLSAGSYIKRGQEFSRIEHDCVLVKRTRQADYETYHDDYLEEMP